MTFIKKCELSFYFWIMSFYSPNKKVFSYPFATIIIKIEKLSLISYDWYIIYKVYHNMLN